MTHMMTVQPIFYDTKDLLDRLVPIRFFEQIKADYPSESSSKIDALRTPTLALIANEEINRYQENVKRFVEDLYKVLPKEVKDIFLEKANERFALNVNHLVEDIARSMQENFLTHFKNQLSSIKNHAQDVSSTTIKAFLSSHKVVLLNFWANWCSPCRTITPTINAIIQQYEGKIGIGKINIDENRKLGNEYAISSIPALLLFNNGKLEEKMIGIKSLEEIKQVIEKWLD